MTAGDVGDALRAARETTASAPADTRVSWKWVAGEAAVLLLTLAGTRYARFDRPIPESSRTITGAPASKNSEANDAFALAMQFMRVQNDLIRAQRRRRMSRDSRA